MKKTPTNNKTNKQKAPKPKNVWTSNMGWGVGDNDTSTGEGKKKRTKKKIKMKEKKRKANSPPINAYLQQHSGRCPPCRATGGSFGGGVPKGGTKPPPPPPVSLTSAHTNEEAPALTKGKVPAETLRNAPPATMGGPHGSDRCPPRPLSPFLRCPSAKNH